MNPAMIQIGMLVLMGIVFYLLLIRPQQKQRKQLNSMREALKVNDHVITIGGLHGKIVEVDGETVTLQCGNARLVYEKRAINTTVSK